MTALRSRRSALLPVLAHLVPGVLLCGLLALVGIVHVTARVLVVDAGYRVSALEHEEERLTRRSTELELELATLKSPARLDKLARQSLLMGPAPPGTVTSLAAPRFARATAQARPVIEHGRKEDSLREYPRATS